MAKKRVNRAQGSTPVRVVSEVPFSLECSLNQKAPVIGAFRSTPQEVDINVLWLSLVKDVRTYYLENSSAPTFKQTLKQIQKVGSGQRWRKRVAKVRIEVSAEGSVAT
jgi:hypothetical protein